MRSQTAKPEATTTTTPGASGSGELAPSICHSTPNPRRRSRRLKDRDRSPLVQRLRDTFGRQEAAR